MCRSELVGIDGPAGKAELLHEDVTKDAAVLVLPCDGQMDYMLKMAEVLPIQYIKKHGEEWFKYLNVVVGYGVASGDLYFLDTCQKVRKWHTEISLSKAHSVDVDLSLNASSGGMLPVTAGVSALITRTESCELPSMPYTGGDEHSLYANQCTRVQGWRIRRSRFLLFGPHRTTAKIIDATDTSSDERERRTVPFAKLLSVSQSERDDPDEALRDAQQGVSRPPVLDYVPHDDPAGLPQVSTPSTNLPTDPLLPSYPTGQHYPDLPEAIHVLAPAIRLEETDLSSTTDVNADDDTVWTVDEGCSGTLPTYRRTSDDDDDVPPSYGGCNSLNVQYGHSSTTTVSSGATATLTTTATPSSSANNCGGSSSGSTSMRRSASSGAPLKSQCAKEAALFDTDVSTHPPDVFLPHRHWFTETHEADGGRIQHSKVDPAGNVERRRNASVQGRGVALPGQCMTSFQ